MLKGLIALLVGLGAVALLRGVQRLLDIEKGRK